MRKKIDTYGSAMLEVVVVMMIFMILASSLYTIAGMKHKKAVAEVSEDEAYYAAVTAVRMMAQEVIHGESDNGTAAYVLTRGDGLEKRWTKIRFIPEDREKVEREIEISVCIWSERNGDELLLGAEADAGGHTKSVTMRLEKKAEPAAVMADDESMVTASASEPAEAIIDRWIPVSYGVLK